MANQLDLYLETIAQGSMEKEAAQKTFGPASAAELAKLAGIKLAEDVCSSCGSHMTKLGSIHRCECGAMKKACGSGKAPPKAKSKMPIATSKKKTASNESFVEPQRQRGARGALNALTGSPSGLVYKQDAADRVQSGALKGLGVGALGGGGIGALLGALAHGKGQRLLGAASGAVPGVLGGGLMGAGVGMGKAEEGYLKDRGITSSGFWLPKHRFTQEAAQKYLEPEDEPVKEGSLVKAADFAKAAEAYDAFEGDLNKVAAYLQAEGMSKEAIGGVLKSIGQGARGMWRALRGTGASGQTLGQAASRAAGGVGEAAKTYGKGIKETFQRGGMGLRDAGGGAFTNARGGTLGALSAVAQKNPELAVGGGALLGAGAYKAASVDLDSIADAAGRILAKHANLDMDELRESVEEAKAREDIPGRAKSWQRAGGLGGAIGGGLGGMGIGYGASKLMGGKGRLLAPLIGGAAGSFAGGAAGQHFGKQHGAEEAAADKMVSMLRAMRAARMGAQSAGGQMNMQPDMSGAGE